VAKTLFALAACLLVASPVAAGVVFEIQTIGQSQGQSRAGTTQVSVEGQFLTFDIPADKPGSLGGKIIYRGDRREMMIVQHDTKSFMLMDLQSMQKMMGQLNQAMSQTAGQFEGMLGSLPEAQRAMLQQKMKGSVPGQQTPQPSQIVIRRLSNTATVYGYPCVLYEVVRDGKRIRNYWVTDWGNIEGGRRDLEPAFADLGKFFQELHRSMPQMGQSDEITNNVFAQVRELGGFPVATREYTESGDLESESALRSAKRQQINPAAFEPPAGYQLQEMFGGGQVPQYRQ